MAEEIEHRFLVSSDEWKQQLPEAQRYQQGYLSLDPKRSVRVRATDDHAVITIKGNPNGLSRSEFEFPIPLSDAKQILQGLCLKPVIVKTRYKLRQDGQLWEIDEYEAENSGLIVAEVEVDSESDNIQKPSWVGEEISGQQRFANTSLVQHPFKTWPENGGAPETTFHLLPEESLREGVTRAIREQLEAAIHALSGNLECPDKLHAGIHEARKGLKKTRSLLRLGRAAYKRIYAGANERLRDLGRKLSPIRDTAALLEMVNEFERQEDAPHIQAARDRLVAKLRCQQTGLVEDFVSNGGREQVIDGLNGILDQLPSWPLDTIDDAAVLAGIKRTVQRGRQAFKIAQENGTADHFHAWRKRAKDLRYQLSFLHQMWPEVLQGYADNAEELEQTLGDDHNLAVLAELLHHVPLWRRDAASMSCLIRGRQAELRRKALQLGALLYSASPKVWTRVISGSEQNLAVH